jgi:hypothetical protein
MFATPKPSTRRVGILYVLTIAVTILLLAASGLPTSALPDDLERGAGDSQNPTRISNADRTATVRARRNGDRDRNRRRQPTATVMADGATEIFGPENGELVSDENGSLEKFCADVEVSNFIARFRMYNPQGGGSGLWEYGLTFREDSEGTGYRYIMSGRNRWFLAVFDSAASEFNQAGTGAVPNMDITRRGFNDIVIMVQDDLLLISVNGEYLTTEFGVAGGNIASQVCLTTDNFSDTESTGRTFQFENFIIEELP